MLRLIVCSLLLCGVLGTVNVSDSSFSLAISTVSMNQLLNVVLLPVLGDVIEEFSQKIPQSCCYAEPATNTRFYLENLAIPESSIVSMGTISSSSNGLLVSMRIQFDLTFYYKLCEKTIGCIAILFCSGDATLGVDVNTKFVLKIAAGPNGEPLITFDQFNMHIDFPHRSGICFLINGLLDSAVPVLNIVLNKEVPHIISGELDKLNAFNQTILIPGAPFDLMWQLTNYSGTSIDGLGLQFVINVLLKSLGNQTGPYHPNPPLPPILTLLQQDEVSFDVTDSLINNILDAFYLATQPAWSGTVSGWKVKANLLASPILYFTDGSGDEAEEIIIRAKLVISKIPLHFTITTTIKSYFVLQVTPQGQLYLQLSPTNFVVNIDSATPPLTNGTKTLIENEIENAWESAIPGVNEMLMAHQIQLPRIADFSNPEIVYRNGYAYLSFDTIPTARPAEETGTFLEGAVRSITQQTLNEVWYGNSTSSASASTGEGCPKLSFFGITKIDC